jgi:hypothetical protein
LSLRIWLGEARNARHFGSFKFGESRRKQDGKLRVPAAHLSGQLDPTHSRHSMIRYQKISRQSVFKKSQSFPRRMYFNDLMSQVF